MSNVLVNSERGKEASESTQSRITRLQEEVRDVLQIGPSPRRFEAP
jgi:hypothetical protein